MPLGWGISSSSSTVTTSNSCGVGGSVGGVVGGGDDGAGGGGGGSGADREEGVRHEKPPRLPFVQFDHAAFCLSLIHI